MTFNDIPGFIQFLESRGQLRRIRVPVSCELEITEIFDRVCKGSGPNVALLFEHVEGYDMPVLINALGTPERMAWALGVDHLDELGARLGRLLDFGMPSSLIERLRKLGSFSEIARYSPKTVSAGACQEVVITHEPSLASLPILKCWPGDGGRFITLPLVITRHPVTGRRNVGTYRMHVYDERTTGMHWHLHKGGAEHLRREESGQRLEVAIALGADPALLYAGSAPLPPDIDEVLFAGWLKRGRVEMVRAKTVDLEVPAQAEIILEGYVDPEERRVEGPFGDHTGYYSLPEEYPVFHLTAITHRRKPVYVTTAVGRPPMEDYAMGKATERLFLPILRLLVPEIVDMSMPAEGVFHNLVIVSIRKSYPGQARKVMYALWGLGLLMLSKMIVVVDADVNVQNLSEVLWRVTNNIDARRDTVIVDGPLDDLDHASPARHFGAKLGIDATRKVAEEGHPRVWPEDIVMTPEIKQLVDRKWRQLGL